MYLLTTEAALLLVNLRFYCLESVVFFSSIRQYPSRWFAGLKVAGLVNPAIVFALPYWPKVATEEVFWFLKRHVDSSSSSRRLSIV